MKLIGTRSPFPAAWAWLVDEAIPEYVKKTYSPRDSWKSKPFSKEDGIFFSKGIHELSALFTDERPQSVPAYFQHPKYRSAYLLYFLPLQAAKFLTIFGLHPQALQAAIDHGSKTGVIRIADLGAGPGTASLSFLLYLLAQPFKEMPEVELQWFDTNGAIMDDGKALAETLANSFPKLRGKLRVQTHAIPWWKAPSRMTEDFSLIFAGHLLNESKAPFEVTRPTWEKIFHRANGGGILLVEPAERRASQILSTLRDDLFGSGIVEETPRRIWGPCLHAGACPLGNGRDWCHFSVPTDIPGRWFKEFSKSLSSERQWVKYSYVWLASSEHLAPQPSPRLRRVVSDPMPSSAGRPSTVLICEPEKPARWPVNARSSMHRGDVVSEPR